MQWLLETQQQIVQNIAPYKQICPGRPSPGEMHLTAGALTQSRKKRNQELNNNQPVKLYPYDKIYCKLYAV